jgi:predicted RNase H-like HicB family nuclease
MKTFNCKVVSRVLIYQDSTGDYVAHALDLDLIGSGNSVNKATKDLENAIESQVTFALQKGDLSMIYFEAAVEDEKRWLEAARKGAQSLCDGDVAIGVEACATVIELSSETIRKIINSQKKHNRFAPSEEPVCVEA